MDPKGKQLLASTGQSLEKISRLFGINLSSYLGKSYSFVLLVLFCFLSYMTWDNVCTGHCANHIIKKFMITLEYTLYVLLIFTMVITSLFHPEQFAFPRQEMLIIDSILESYGAQFSDKDIFIMKHLQDAVTVTLSLFFTMKCSYERITSNSTELIWLSIHTWYSVICLLVIDGLLSHYVNDIYLRFRELNKIAAQHSKDKLLVSYINFTTADAYDKRNDLVISKIRSIQHIHYTLTVLAMKVNANFSLHLLISSALCLNAIILNLYDIYHNMKTDENRSDTIVFQVIFIFCSVLRSLYISYICQRTRNEVEYQIDVCMWKYAYDIILISLYIQSRRMTKILHDVFLKHKSLRSEVIYFSLQLVHQDLVFTACGLYEINISLMCSIAGAIVTYLVMVIQLDVTEKFAIANTTQSYIADNSTNNVSLLISQ
ncbi:gustatory receptor for sugar taste 43a-like isoform X1 [Odontomachus brunneus]|uniref:gustatory receptor for sugar taste 43a-like isoform X1 n=1 Tax=Odontomachus brunneus TaxID=486640 RepID=UPI0013F28697|nr:gustatory receptor for sugar taste 43a-like isoform X1 [Odontomachus brunneus]